MESPRRVLQILLRFTESRPHATIAELAGEIGIPNSTCYRYVSLLREMGLLEEGHAGTYHVTPRVWSLARAADAAESLTRVALPVMRRLGDRTRETVMLLRVIADAAVCVERIPPNRPVQITYEPGQPMALHHGASGKSLLAAMPAQRRTAYLDAHCGQGRERAALEAELELIAGRGWAISRGEIDEGIWACSALIRGGGHADGTLTVVGPEYRIPAETQDEIRDMLLAGAAEIAAELRSHDGQ